MKILIFLLFLYQTDIFINILVSASLNIPYILDGKLNCDLPELYSTAYFAEKVIPCDGVENCMDGSDELCDLSINNNKMVCSDDLLNYSAQQLLANFKIKKCDAVQDCQNLWDEELCFMWLPWGNWQQVDFDNFDSDSNCYVFRERFCKNVDNFSLEEKSDNWKCFRFAEDTEKDIDKSVGYSPYRDQQVLSCTVRSKICVRRRNLVIFGRFQKIK